MLKQTIWAVATICALAASAQSNSLADAQIDSTLRSNKIIFIDGKPARNKHKDMWIQCGM